MGKMVAEEFDMSGLYSQIGQAGLLGSAMGVGIQQQMYEQMNNYAGAQIAQTPHNQTAFSDYFARLHLKTEEAIRKGLLFFRVNRECLYQDENSIEEPLDELRVSVARWLKGATA